jgi:hypothetical protein
VSAPEPHHSALLDFAALLRWMAEAEVVVEAVQGRLLLVHRRGRPVPEDVAIAARFYTRLLAWTALAGSCRWHACDVCGMPQLARAARKCHMTPGCTGHVRPLPAVTRRRRQRRRATQ